MIKIYHNPKCSKSRQGLALLEEKKVDFEVIKYLETCFTEESLKEILAHLGIKPIELIRKNEAIWKTDFKHKTLTDQELITLMVAHPKLIERPIVVNKNQAVIARPTENILSIL